MTITKQKHFDMRQKNTIHQEYSQKRYAYLLPRNPNVKYEKMLLQTQREAMSAKQGIWQNWNEQIESPPNPPKYGGRNGGLFKLAILWLCLFLLRFFGRFGQELRRNVKIPW